MSIEDVKESVAKDHDEVNHRDVAEHEVSQETGEAPP